MAFSRDYTNIYVYFRYLEDFKNVSSHDTKGLIKAIENLHPDFYIYKGAEFWKDAALEYLRNDVLKVKECTNANKAAINDGGKKTPVEKLTSSAFGIMTLGGTILGSILALVYLKRNNWFTFEHQNANDFNKPYKTKYIKRKIK